MLAVKGDRSGESAAEMWRACDVPLLAFTRWISVMAAMAYGRALPPPHGTARFCLNTVLTPDRLVPSSCGRPDGRTSALDGWPWTRDSTRSPAAAYRSLGAGPASR